MAQTLSVELATNLRALPNDERRRVARAQLDLATMIVAELATLKDDYAVFQSARAAHVELRKAERSLRAAMAVS